MERDSKIATLGVGYGDGYPRNLSSKGVVAINGHRAPVVGLVCMDQTLIDVTDIPEIQIGDVAELLGNQIFVQELATLTNTNSHEILTRIMTRVMRRYVSQA
ncbi:MAG: alanine racemase C-terminal domain-containing protein [Fimbriimonadaceae bacterium]